MRFEVSFKDGKREVIPAPAFAAASALDPEKKRPLLRLVGAEPPGGALTVAQVGPRALVIQAVVEKKALVGGSRREESLAAVDVQTDRRDHRARARRARRGPVRRHLHR